MFERFLPMLPGAVMDNAKENFKSAQKVNGYRVSDQAFFKPSGEYLLRSCIQDVVADKGSTHVTGCCIGALPVDRLVITTEQKKFTCLFDSPKLARQAAQLLGFPQGEE